MTRRERSISTYYHGTTTHDAHPTHTEHHYNAGIVHNVGNGVASLHQGLRVLSLAHINFIFGIALGSTLSRQAFTDYMP